MNGVYLDRIGLALEQSLQTIIIRVDIYFPEALTVDTMTKYLVSLSEAVRPFFCVSFVCLIACFAEKRISKKLKKVMLLLNLEKERWCVCARARVFLCFIA